MSHRSRLSQALGPESVSLPLTDEQERDIRRLDSFFGEEPAELPILHLTPTWSDLIMVDPTEDDICCVTRHQSGQLVCMVRAFVQDEMVPFTIPVSHRSTFETHPDGSMKCYAMRQIGPHTWKIDPSVNIPGLIHAFVVLCNVPEPPPWGKL